MGEEWLRRKRHGPLGGRTTQAGRAQPKVAGAGLNLTRATLDAVLKYPSCAPKASYPSRPPGTSHACPVGHRAVAESAIPGQPGTCNSRTSKINQ